MAQHYYNISSNASYHAEFRNIYEQEENRPVQFNSNANYDYNVEISFKEVMDAMAQCKNTAPGNDAIGYQMLRHLSESAYASVLTLLNKIWMDNVFPESWGEVVVFSFLKKDKPQTEAGRYHPIALTSCLCKLPERVSTPF